jgi:threonylcarbamoyladenosine tRNA methylthiotransferase MtaB
MPSVYVKTMGCKVNTFDAHVIENQFKKRGYELQTEPNLPDITVVNTCSVTAAADREARYLARRLRRENPNTLLVFTGCYAQTDSARLAAMEEIDMVIPNQVKDSLVQMVEAGLGSTSSKLPQGVAAVVENRQTHFKSSLTLFDHSDSVQTRAFVKIQDGCNGFCSYCLIPYARGQSRSVPGAQILSEINRLIALGTYEIVLTGIHIGDYGRDFSGETHPEPILPLLRQIFEIPGLGRLRISSLEPGELSGHLVDLLKEYPERICQHFHLPLQSGSDPILKAMRRSYLRDGYRAAVERIRNAFPEVSLGADVIPGFPGESDQHFQDTVDFIEGLGLSYLHVFPYSKRPNTAAAKMPGHLPGPVVSERAKTLRDLSHRLSTQYARSFIGRSMDVLWESDRDQTGRPLGRTGNYLHVAASRDHGSLEASGQGLPLERCQKVFLKGLIPDSQGIRLLGRLL